MGQPIYCDQGCGQLYAMEIGLPEEPVHRFYCIAHAYAWWLTFMDAIEEATVGMPGAEPGDVKEGTEAVSKRGRRRGPSPERVAVDSPLRPVVEDAQTPPEDERSEEG